MQLSNRTAAYAEEVRAPAGVRHPGCDHLRFRFTEARLCSLRSECLPEVHGSVVGRASAESFVSSS
jgi:hypothetical protein